MNPAEDIFDVVNEHDEIIDQQPRSLVHSQGLDIGPPMCWCSIRSAKSSFNYVPIEGQPSWVWDNSCSGHVDAGESYAVAAERELMEEIGLLVEEPLEELFKLEAHPENGMEFVTVFMTEDEGPFELNAEEIDAGR